MLETLPKSIILNDTEYYLDYYEEKEDKDFKGWWFCVYLKDEKSLPPEVKTKGFIEFLCSSGLSEEETYNDMYRKLKESKLI